MSDRLKSLTFEVFYSPEDEEWVAVPIAMPHVERTGKLSLSWLADTPQGALEGLLGVMNEVAVDMDKP